MALLKTISKDYLKMNKAMHKAPKGFGGGGGRHAEAIIGLAKEGGLKTVLDYGAGQGKLKEALDLAAQGLEVTNYDPAIVAYSQRPVGLFDLVACTDVLEHIEPQYLDNVLTDLEGLTKKVAYFEIATRPANKKLPDGRNAHLIIEKTEWWVEKLSRYNWAKLDVQEIIHPEKTPQLRAIVVTAYK